MLTVLCADIAGGMSLREMLSESEAVRAVDRCAKRVGNAVESYGGSVVNRTEDKLLAVFAASEEAFQAAVVIQNRVADLPAVSGVKLSVRISICSGNVFSNDGQSRGQLEAVALRLAEQTQSGQILFCLAKEKQTDSLAGGNLPALKQTHLTIKFGDTELAVSEFDWQKCGALPESIRTAQAVSGGDRLVIRHNDQEIVLDHKKPTLTIGRDASCDLVLRDSRSSRLHAQIEKRGNQFVVVDKSTNGTFVTLEGKRELYVRHRELVLSGRGQLSFAAPASTAGTDQISFQV